MVTEGGPALAGAIRQNPFKFKTHSYTFAGEMEMSTLQLFNEIFLQPICMLCRPAYRVVTVTN